MLLRYFCWYKVGFQLSVSGLDEWLLRFVSDQSGSKEILLKIRCLVHGTNDEMSGDARLSVDMRDNRVGSSDLLGTLGSTPKTWHVNPGVSSTWISQFITSCLFLGLVGCAYTRVMETYPRAGSSLGLERGGRRWSLYRGPDDYDDHARQIKSETDSSTGCDFFFRSPLLTVIHLTIWRISRQYLSRTGVRSRYDDTEIYQWNGRQHIR